MSHYTIRFSGGRRRRWSPNMVTVRVCWKLKTSWKSAVFTKKVGKNSPYLVGVFNKKNYSTRYAPRLRAWNQLFRSGASWRLTENFWSPDRKFWSPTYFIYNLHKNTILYVTLHARKVTTEERKQLETTRVTLSYKATVVLRWYVSGPKVMVVSIVILNEAKHKTF